MTIALTSDQQELAEAVAGFTARHAAITVTRAAFDKIAVGELQPSWQALVDQGLHAIHLPAWAGGDGAGLVELAVVLEQAAFGLFPGPLLPTVFAGQLIAEHAPEPLARRLLPGLVAGATAAGAVTAAGLRAVKSDAGWRISGETPPVLGAASAQILVLGAESDGGTVWFVLDAGQRGGTEIVQAEPVDLTRDVGRLMLSDVRVRDERIVDLSTPPGPRPGCRAVRGRGSGGGRWCLQTGWRTSRCASSSARRSAPSRPSSTSAPRCSSRGRAHRPPRPGTPPARSSRTR